MTRTVFSLVLGLTLAGVATSSAAAPRAEAAPQAASSAAANPWDLWAGCWSLIEETSDDGSATVARLLGLPAPRTRSADSSRVCVSVDAPGQATLATTLGDRPGMTETIVADGTQRPMADPECRGWQKAEWSTLGPRLYTAAELSCGTQAARKVSGMSLMTVGPTWIDIQVIEGGGQKNIRVRKYRPVPQTGVARRPAVAPRPLLSRFSVADVKDAAAKVAPEAVQAALLELKGGFDLKARTLVELADAGVAPNVIDLMVALSFPQRFVVDRAERRGGSGGGGLGGPWSFDAFDQNWPFWMNPYLMTSYYAPFGYRYWGYYDNYYFTGPGFVVINPGGGSGGPPEASGDGRVVDGRGYTQVRRADPQPINSGFGSASGFSTASSGGSSGSGSTGSSGVSSSGYSGGGSGSGGGERTAQPRPPGGGN